jgi:hypothetical protein
MLKNNMNWRKTSLLRAIFYEFLTVGRAKAAMWVKGLIISNDELFSSIEIFI